MQWAEVIEGIGWSVSCFEISWADRALPSQKKPCHDAVKHLRHD